MGDTELPPGIWEAGTSRVTARFWCPHCDAVLPCQSKLEIHIRKHTRERPHRCECGLRFQTRSSLNRHYRTTHTSSSETFICPDCEHVFHYRSDLVRHRRNTHGDRPRRFFCEQCKAQFSSLDNCRQHWRLHLNTKPFACSQCPATFTTASKLRIHTRIHSGERPFECPTCVRCFIDSSALIAHRRICQVQADCRPFECAMCEKRYRHPSSLSKHVRIEHGEKNNGRGRNEGEAIGVEQESGHSQQEEEELPLDVLALCDSEALLQEHDMGDRDTLMMLDAVALDASAGENGNVFDEAAAFEFSQFFSTPILS